MGRARVHLGVSVQQATAYAERATALTGRGASRRDGGRLTMMVLAVLACSHGRLPGPVKWLTLAGALTYPLYLVHGQVGFFLIETLQTHLQSYVVLAIATLTSFALAFLIHRFVERPAARPLRRAVDRSLESLSVR